MYLINIFLSTLLIKLINGENVITLPLQYSYGTYELPIIIGNSKQLTKLEINLQSTFMWISSLYMENNYEVSIKEEIENLDINQKEYQGLQVIGNVYLNHETKIQNYPFYYILSSDVKGYDTFSLSYSCKNKSYSVIQNLYTNKVIDKQKFGLSYNLNNKTAFLFIGGIPKKQLKEFTNSIALKMDNLYPFWGALLDKITLVNIISYEVQNFTIFQANSKYINVPVKFLDFLKKEIFQKYFYNLTCFSAIYIDGYGIECQYDWLDNFPNIIFTFNGNNFTLNKEDLFEISREQMSSFMIRSNKNNNNWEFGLSFIGKYLTSFDYDESTITFYNDNSFYTNKSKFSKTKPQLIILFMIIGELLTAMSVLIKKIL